MGKGMRIAGKRIGAGRIPVWQLFAAGILAGILIMNIGESILLENTGLFDEDVLYRMKYMTVDCNALFYYVLRKRLMTLLILAVLSTTYLGLAICVGTVLWYGTAAGGLLAVMMIRYGMKGILLAAACLFPQYMLYFPAMFAFWGWGESVYGNIYLRGGLEPEKNVFFKKMGQLAGIIGMTVAGCAMEGFINPLILAGVLKMF